MSYMGLFYEKEREQIRKIAHEEALAVFAEKVELEKERIKKEAKWLDTVSIGHLDVLYSALLRYSTLCAGHDKGHMAQAMLNDVADEIRKRNGIKRNSLRGKK